MKNFTIFILTLLTILTAVFLANPKLLNLNYSFIFNEFIQSSNFSQLLKDNRQSFNYRVNGGTYNLGLPLPPHNETVYGTNRGLRVLPLILFLTLLQKLWGVFWDRFYFLIILALPFFIFYQSAKSFFPKSNPNLRLIAALVFAFNPWVFTRLITGFWQLNLAYAFLPLSYFTLVALLKETRSAQITRLSVAALVSLSISYFFQPHFLVILAIPLGSYYTYHIVKDKKLALNRLFWGKVLLVFLGFLLLNAFQILPSLFYQPFRITIPQDFHLGAVLTHGAQSQLLDVLRLSPPKAFLLNFGFFALAIIFVGLFLRSKPSHQKRRTLVFVILMLTIFIFLAKGLNPPFAFLSRFIYDHFIFMHVFRDPSRFYAAIALFLSLIFLIETKVNRSIKFLYFLFLFWFFPTISFLAFNLGKEIGYQKLPVSRYENFNNLPSTSRTLLIPNGTDLKYFTWYEGNVDSINNSPLEALVPLEAPLANFSGSVDNYFSQLEIFAQNKFYSGENFGHLFSRLGVDSVLIDSGVEPAFIGYNRLTDSQNTLNNNGYQKVREVNGVTLYQRLGANNAFFSTQKPIFLVGNLNDFNTLSQKIDANTPVVLLNQKINLKAFLQSDLEKQLVVFSNQNELEKVFLNGLDHYSARLEKPVWNYDREWNLAEPYLLEEIKRGVFFNSGRSITTSKPNGQFSFEYKTKPGKYLAFVSSLKTSAGGEIALVINNKKYLVSTLGNPPRLAWDLLEEVELRKKNKIIIQNNSLNPPIIDDLLFIPTDIFQEKKEQFERALKKNQLIFLESLSHLIPPKVISEEKKIRQASFAQWEVNSASNWVTFNFPYDYGWETNNQKARFIGNFYGMTFLADNTETKIVEYQPEKIFRFSLYLSGLSWLSLWGGFFLNLTKRVTKPFSNSYS